MKELVNTLTCQLDLAGRFRTACAYRSAMHSVLCVMGISVLGMDMITPEFLFLYQTRLLDQQFTYNGVSFYMRMLRTVYNQGATLGYCPENPKLFANVYTGNARTTKRAVSPTIFGLLQALDLSKYPKLEFCRDLFLLSFALQGISFIDLAYLNKSNLKNNILTYYRAKTGGQVSVAVDDFALNIIKKYSGHDRVGNFLLPIIINPDKDYRLQYQSALRSHNRRLQKLADMASIVEHLTSYVSRHTYATTARNEEVPLSMISQAMGHKDTGVTQTYFADYDVEKLFSANAKVLQAANLIGSAEYQPVVAVSAKNKNVRHLRSDRQLTGQR